MSQVIATIFLAIILAGLISITYGCYLIWQPLGYIVCGFLLIGFAIIMNQAELPEGGDNKNERN